MYDNIDFQVHPKRDRVIYSWHVPKILGDGPEFAPPAEDYIKRGETLNPHYYPDMHARNPRYVVDDIMSEIFDPFNKHPQLSEALNTDVYRGKGHTCIFQIKLTGRMGLVGRADGIIKDGTNPGRPIAIVMVDEYEDGMADGDAQKRIIGRAVATMAVFKVNICHYYVAKSGYWIDIPFDEDEWQDIKEIVTKWSKFTSE